MRTAAAGVAWTTGSGSPLRREVVGDTGARYAWASVTKLCTALAVLVAVEEGVLGLEEPAGPPGSTVAHLLAHASGLGPSGTQVLAQPGRRRIYSNQGYKDLAALLAERSGIDFGTYVVEAVLEPLGMRGAHLGPLGSRDGRSEEYDERSANYAASGMHGSLADLMALGCELLRPRLLAPETLRRATSVAFPGLAGVLPGFGYQDPCDWGLGFELRDAKSPHWTGRSNSPQAFGHFGQAGGFLWVDPTAGVACTALTDRRFGTWATEAWPRLADAVLAELGRGG